MSGLLSGVLPAVYGGANRLQNRLAELLRNPSGVMAQTAGGILDAHRDQQQTMNQAFANKQRPLQVTDPQALSKATQNMMAGPLGFAPVGMTVWHGSPHKFNAFDSTKIGTGEGNQAYGHGLYLAEAPAVAEDYAKVLGGGKEYFLGGEKIRLANKSPYEQQAFQAITDPQSYGATKKEWLSRYEQEGVFPEQIKKLSDAWDRVSAQNPQVKVNTGNLYKVDLPDEHIAKMLDWDKPLSQQPKAVRDAIKSKEALGEKLNFDERATGEQIYKQLTQDPTNRASANELNWLGIPGIRYLDGGSRGTGAGTSNFVVFPGNEGLLTILERNNQPVNQLVKLLRE